MRTTTAAEAQLRLYLFYMWIWEKGFGHGEWASRLAAIPWFLPGAVAFVLTAGARLRAPWTVGLMAGLSPFLWYYLDEARVYAAQIGLPPAVSPSGTPLLTADNLARLKQAGAKAISLSVDGSTPERHDDFRRVPGSFVWTTEGWRAARQMGLKLQINTTVTRYNLQDLPNLFRLVQELGAMPDRRGSRAG